jgi:hypothetical protein
VILAETSAPRRLAHAVRPHQAERMPDDAPFVHPVDGGWLVAEGPAGRPTRTFGEIVERESSFLARRSDGLEQMCETLDEARRFILGTDPG